MTTAEAKRVAKQRVTAGMKWLDRHYPDHADRIDLGMLNMGDGRYCVLAQASEQSFASASLDNHLDEETEWKLGFLPSFAEQNAEEQTLLLHREWVTQYVERGAFDAYNGHCRDCYAFKGEHSGECVDSECNCH